MGKPQIWVNQVNGHRASQNHKIFSRHTCHDVSVVIPESRYFCNIKMSACNNTRECIISCSNTDTKSIDTHRIQNRVIPKINNMQDFGITQTCKNKIKKTQEIKLSPSMHECNVNFRWMENRDKINLHLSKMSSYNKPNNKHPWPLMYSKKKLKFYCSN